MRAHLYFRSKSFLMKKAKSASLLCSNIKVVATSIASFIISSDMSTVLTTAWRKWGRGMQGEVRERSARFFGGDPTTGEERASEARQRGGQQHTHLDSGHGFLAQRIESRG